MKIVALGLAALVGAGCASSAGGSDSTPRYTVVKGDERPPETSGVPPDKQAEVELVLQQREVSTKKCYQDVLNEKHDRNFQGTVQVLISLGTQGQATDVKAVGGTLADKEVERCLVDTVKSFEFPQLSQSGDVQYTFRFRPAY